MTAPLTRKKQLGVVRLFFQGDSYDEVSRHLDVSKASVEMVVARLKGGEYEEFRDATEEVDVLREIAVYVKKHMDGDIQRCHEGCVAWAGLRKMGVDPSEVRDIAALFEELAPPEANRSEFVKTALWCKGLSEKLDIDIADLPQHLAALEQKLDALQRETTALEAQGESLRTSVRGLREELGLLQDITGLRTKRSALESQVAEIQGRTRAALAAAKVTEERLAKYQVFSGTMAAKGVPVNGESFETLLDLTVTLGPQGIDTVAVLSTWLASEQLGAQQGISILADLRRHGFNARQAECIVRSLGEKGSFSSGMRRLMALFQNYETVDAAVETATQELEVLKGKKAATSAETTRLQGVKAGLEASIEDLEHEEEDAAKGSEARQREADEHLKATEKRQQEMQEYNHKLVARNVQLTTDIVAMNERVPALRNEEKEATRNRDEAKARLQTALGIEGEWEDLQRALRSAREKGEREMKELEDRIQAERDTLTLAAHLKFALGGDPRYARFVFAHYAREPTIYRGLRDPVPAPEAALDQLVDKAFELLGNRAIRREEHERAAEAHKAEAGRLQKELDANGNVIKDLEARIARLERDLKDRDRDKRSLEVELHGTQKRLEWSEEFRAKLVAEQRRGPPAHR